MRAVPRRAAFLAPFEPDRGGSFFTEATQRVRLAELAERRRAGAGDAWVILDDGEPAGVISLSNIVRGPFQSANVGYFVAQGRNGRGIATTAVRLVVGRPSPWSACTGSRPARWSTTSHRSACWRRPGFERIGLARRYLHIAGGWRDHILFQRLSDD